MGIVFGSILAEKAIDALMGIISGGTSLVRVTLDLIRKIYNIASNLTKKTLKVFKWIGRTIKLGVRKVGILIENVGGRVGVNPKNLLDLDKAEILNLGLSVNNARYLIQVKELIANIRLPKFIENLRLKHILQGDKGGGGHHLPSLAAGDHTLVNIPTSPNNKGVYRATIKYENYNGKIVTTTKTMFPDHWTGQKTIDSIQEAYQNRPTNPIPKKTNLYLSQDNQGIEIYIAIDLKTQKIISAYPKI
jgi:hypothetical protein